MKKKQNGHLKLVRVIIVSYSWSTYSLPTVINMVNQSPPSLSLAPIIPDCGPESPFQMPATLQITSKNWLHHHLHHPEFLWLPFQLFFLDIEFDRHQFRIWNLESHCDVQGLGVTCWNYMHMSYRQHKDAKQQSQGRGSKRNVVSSMHESKAVNCVARSRTEGHIFLTSKREEKPDCLCHTLERGPLR